MKKKEPLQIDQDLSFERMEWKLQRIAWAAMVLVLLLALLGVLGGGPLAKARAHTPDGRLALDYERWLRRDCQSSFVVHAVSDAYQDTLEVWFDGKPLQELRVQRVIPEPTEQAIVGDRVVYRFADVRRSHVTDIEFDVFPSAIGSVRLEAGVEEDSLAVSLFVYP